MMAARLLLRRAAPALRQVRGYAEAVTSATQMSFTFASPTEVFFKAASVKQVDVPTMTGAFGILPAHVPTLQVLRPGVVTVFSEDGSSSKYFVSSGSITVNADSSVQLLAEEAVPLESLDLAVRDTNKSYGFISILDISVSLFQPRCSPNYSLLISNKPTKSYQWVF
uniref:ATP synthase F(1) complex subunit delta, mitochondrial n=1 Tax=Electrophorus electricus TaxID=8005 RepID=A0AAY5EZI7_ELEEL